MTSGCRGTPYFRGYDQELVLKPAISLKKSWGAYRRTTLGRMQDDRSGYDSNEHRRGESDRRGGGSMGIRGKIDRGRLLRATKNKDDR